MGLLDDLKKEANARREQNTADADTLRHNTRLVDGSLQRLFLYLNEFGKSLNVLRPQYPDPYLLPFVGTLENLMMIDFFCDYRSMNVDGRDRFTEVYLAFKCVSPMEFNLTRDVTGAQRLRDLLWGYNVRHRTEEVRNDKKALTHEKFVVNAEFPVQINFEGEHPAGLIRMTCKNLGEFGAFTHTVAAGKFDDTGVEELAKMVLGKPHNLKALLKSDGPPFEIRKREIVVPDYAIHDASDAPFESNKDKPSLLGAIKSLVKSTSDPTNGRRSTDAPKTGKPKRN